MAKAAAMATETMPAHPRLLLAGGGHSHALVLRMWAMDPLPGIRLTVINPNPTAPTLTCSASGLAAAAQSTQTAVVCMLTSSGEMVFELFATDAPITVQNFLGYVGTSFYSNTLVHRVDRDFVIQGGGFSSGMVAKSTQAPIQLEDNNGRSNVRGTIAMARTGEPNSATSQWFVNVGNNSFLDYSPQQRGYAVFGRLIAGTATLDAINALPVITYSPTDKRPQTEVLVYWVQRVR